MYTSDKIWEIFKIFFIFLPLLILALVVLAVIFLALSLVSIIYPILYLITIPVGIILSVIGLAIIFKGAIKFYIKRYRMSFGNKKNSSTFGMKLLNFLLDFSKLRDLISILGYDKFRNMEKLSY